MLTRWDPFREMLNWRSMVDRMLEGPFFGERGDWQTPTWGLALDVAEKEDEYVVKASIPGINPDDLDITYSGDTLTIKGEIKEDKQVEEARYHLRERSYGSFARSISLPTKIEGDKIEAKYESGVLTLHLPKAEEAKAKRITVKSGPSQKVLEGHFEKDGQ